MMKRNLVFFLMLTILVTSVAGNADAQFWKKKSKRHSHKHKQDDGNTQTDSVSVAPPVKDEKSERKEKKKKHKEDRKKKKQESKAKKKEEKKAKVAKKHGGSTATVVKTPDKVPALPTKNRYRVDVLASLYLDELVKGGAVTYKDKIPDKAIPGVAFYAGINIAADSLKKEGFNIDIYVHDITSFLESPERLTTLGGLDSTDLIIGAVQPADIPMFADYAKKNSVNFISTLSASDGGVHDNLYFTMMQPTLKTHCEWIVGDIMKKYPGQKVSLLYQTKGSTENNAYSYLTDAPIEDIHFKYLACNTLPKKENFGMVVDTTKSNVMVVAVSDTRFADSLLHELTSDYPRTHFEIYGMPSWTSIADLNKKGTFPNLTVNVTTPFINDPATTGQYVKSKYKKEYSGKLTESVYRGYETMFWYADLLKKYGTHFSEKYSENPAGPFTQFDIEAMHDKSNHLLYYENKHIFLVSYEDGVCKTK